MSERARSNGFETFRAGLGVQDRTLLGAIALEQALPLSVLESLSPAPAQPAPAWLKRAHLQGWVVPANVSRGGSLRPHVALPVELEQPLLRELAATGELPRIAAVTHALLTLRSLADLTLALQSGELDEFLRRFASRRLAPERGPATRAEWLRRALCEPFDAAWLLGVWQGDAERVATQVLEECLIGPSACDDLYAWLDGRGREVRESQDGARSAEVLIQHALLRARPQRSAELTATLGAESALGIAPAAHFLKGNLPGAQASLDAFLASPRRTAGSTWAALAPLYALLLCARDDEAGRTAARRLLNTTGGEVGRGALRAVRTLLKYQSQPPEEQRRIDVHQLSPDISGWELLVLGLTVHLHQPDKWARANWCQEFVSRARAWHSAGYHWFARQTLFLAELLDETSFGAALSRLAPELLPAPIRSSRELVLWDLITVKADWQRALEALTAISEATPSPTAHGYRVAWYVDMVRGELSRPALQDCRPSVGWNDGRRVSLAELWPVYADLPPEDQRVLDFTNEARPGARDFTPDALEALIGHPRVVNALHPDTAVQVLRGTPRLEAREDRGHTQLFVEPSRVSLGVNALPEAENRLAVYRVTKEMQRVIDALGGGARIPKSHERELLRVLEKLSDGIEVRSPELVGECPWEADATPCLRFSPHAGAWLVQLGVRPFAERGRFFLAGVGRASVSAHVGGQRLQCERDLGLERERQQQLRLACPTFAREDDEERSLFDVEDSFTLGEEGVLALLSELREAGLPCALEWPEAGGLRLADGARSKSVHGRLRSDKGWYLLSGGLSVNSVTQISLSELVRAPALGGGRFVRLANGDFLELEARVRRLVLLLKAFTAKGRASADLRLPASALTALLELGQPDSGFQLDAPSEAFLERVRGLSGRDFVVPRGLRATLRPYQSEGFRWLSQLCELGFGACLADDMGLGKTVQILALLVARAEEGRGDGPTLVVAPTSVCSNWVAEIARFAPSLRAIEYLGSERAQALANLGPEAASENVVVCSYTILQQDQPALAARAWGTVVLDEAQFIKNPESLRARAAYSLTAKQRVAATGTPVENHLGDLWGIFRFLNPGLLGDFAHFKRTFLMPVARDSGEESTAALHELVKPFLLRRMKQEVALDLPPITEVQHEVRFSADETLRYALLRKQIHDKLYTSHGKRNNKLEVLAEIMRLRRFCCHPALVFPDAPSECSKIDAFLALVEELRQNQHRALVFSQFVDFLSLVRERLAERGIGYEYLDGRTPPHERKASVSAFQEGAAPLFLISLKAGGFGLNLTAADYVIHLDPWWNPAVQAQASDRAHRIGQERPVTVYRLITKDSIEEDLVRLHAKKRELSSALLGDGAAAAGLSSEELSTLIRESLRSTL